MTIPYISIKSVIYDLALTIDDRYWNEAYSLEFATRAAKTIRAEVSLQDQVEVLAVTSHSAQLPKNLKYLTQVAYKIMTPSEIEACFELPSTLEIVSHIHTLPYKPMRLNSSPFHLSICTNEAIYNCTDCLHSFSVTPSLALKTTLKEGIILVAYKGYPVDDEGYILIPDDETYKEAILHYVLYRYWMSKYQMKEEGSTERMRHHLSMWSTLSKKALNLNNPDVSQLENLKSIHNRLVPRSNRFNQLFQGLSSSESIPF
jgi:hypothetical protein